MVQTKWTKVTTRLGGKKFSISKITPNTKTISIPKSTKISNVVAESEPEPIQNSNDKQTATENLTISENTQTSEKNHKSGPTYLAYKQPPEHSRLHLLELRYAGKYARQDRNNLKKNNTSFMEHYKKVENSLQRLLCQSYTWPPTEQNLQTCTYFDDDICSNVSYTSEESPPKESSTNEVIDNNANVFENILIVNIDGCTAVEDIRKEFPTATRVYLENMNGINSKCLFSATVQFSSIEEAQKKFQESSLKKIGRKTLEWIRSNEIKIENLPPVPQITKHELKRMFPPEVKRIELRAAQRQAIMRFRTAEQACQAYRSSFLFPLGDRTLGWISPELRARIRINTSFASLDNAWSGDSETDCDKTISDIDEDTIKTGVDQLANSDTYCKSQASAGKIPNNRFSWQSQNYCRRNSTKMFYSSKTTTNNIHISKFIMARPRVYVLRLPKNITLKTIRRIFPKALKIDIEDFKGGKLAVVEFDTTICAARACYDASRVKIGGHFIKVSPRKPHGFRRPRARTDIKGVVKEICGV